MVARMQLAPRESDLRQLVLSEIGRDPKAKETDIGVEADNGMITLTGSVKTEAERMAVETAVKRVPGVRAVASDLTVEPLPDRDSSEIVRDVLKGLKSHIFLAGEDVRVIVRNGVVTLEGEVHQELQKMLAEAQVRRIRGLCGISNLLVVKPDAPARLETETGIEGAGPSNDAAWVDTGEAEAG